MNTKICPICSKSFVPSSNAVKYCSEECAKTVRKMIPIRARKCTCKGCGEVFETKRVKTYCSERCRMYANGRGKLKIEEKIKKKKPVYTLSQVAALANAAGVTYGKYVQMHNI